jgi:hypothetical protein
MKRGLRRAADSAVRAAETDAALDEELMLSSAHTQHPDSFEPGRHIRRFISY